MSILITLIASVVLVVLQLTTAGYFEQQTKSHQSSRERIQMTEAVRSMAPFVREAAELWMRTAKSGGTDCPTGTVKWRGKKYDGSYAFLCWRSSAPEGQCVKFREENPLWICPIQTGGVFADQMWRRWIFPRAEAGVTLPYLQPQGMAVAEKGVVINTPVCGSGQPCVDCRNTDTMCFTLKFCVNSSPSFSCPVKEQVTQSFAFRM